MSRVADSPDLFLPGQHGGAQSDVSHITTDNARPQPLATGERQTLRRLPQSGQIAPLRALFQLAGGPRAKPATWPDRRMAPDFRAYKGITPIADAAIAWLDRAARGK